MSTLMNGERDLGAASPSAFSAWGDRVPWLISVGLVLALTLYCQLSAFVEHETAAIATSIGWALRVSAGWIVVGAVMWRFGPRLLSWGLAKRHPRLFLGSLFLASCTVTLISDYATANQMAAMDFVFRRLPALLLGNGLLLAMIFLAKRRTQTSLFEARSQTETVRHAAVLPTIEVMTGTGRTRVLLSEIECFEADGNYVNVVHKSGRTYLVRQTLVELQKLLDSRFARVHRSTIVNSDAIVERRTGGILALASGRTVRVSRRFSAEPRAGSLRLH